MVQLYNEQLYDMLRDARRVHPLAIHEQPHGGIYVQGLSEYAVHDASECLQLLRVGRDHRCYNIFIVLSCRQGGGGTRAFQRSMSDSFVRDVRLTCKVMLCSYVRTTFAISALDLYADAWPAFLATGRAIRETHMNHSSSRSHSIFQIVVEQTRRSEQDGEYTLRSKFNLVDLAG